MDLRLDPLLPLWLVVLVALGLLAISVRVYMRWSWPAGLRLLVLLVIALLLANPVLVSPAAKRVPGRIAVVLDTSASMGVRDGGTTTRLQRARDALDRAERILGDRYRIERYSLGESLTAGTSATAHGGTDYNALAHCCEDPPMAIILASDGGDHGTVTPDAALAAAHIPVFALAVGSQTPATNVAVQLEAPSPTAFPAQDMTLTAVVSATGDALGAQSELIITGTKDGADQEILRKTLHLTAEQRVPVTVNVGDGAGERLWTARIAPVAGEVTRDDNQAETAVQVVDRAVRVLVVEGQPYWDTSFAVRAWRRDRQLSVAATYKVGVRTFRVGAQPADPLTTTALKDIDVVVVGAQSDSMLTSVQAQALATFVDGGGGLLFLGAGSDREAGGPLAGLDPLLHRQGRSDEVVAAMTVAGRDMALLPSGEAANDLARVSSGQISTLRPRTDVLLGTEQQPLVAIRHSGAGMVGSVNAEGMWRWTLETKTSSDPELAARFWRQLIKTLVHDEQGRLSADRMRYRVGDEALITAVTASKTAAGQVVAGAVVPVKAQSPDHHSASVAINQGAGRLRLDQPGLYVLTQGPRRLTLVVDADVREITDVQRRDDRLARLATTTNGAVAEYEQAADVAKRLVQRADLQVAAPHEEPVISSPWWLVLIASLLAGEWFVRRRRYGVV